MCIADHSENLVHPVRESPVAAGADVAMLSAGGKSRRGKGLKSEPPAGKQSQLLSEAEEL